MAQALYWREIYTGIVDAEERFIAQVRHLMVGLSYEAHRAIELNNVAPVLAQIDKCRHRLGYWDACVAELDGPEPVKAR
jgi:hypothetical protein